MKEEMQLLIELVKQNKTLNEISNILNLSNKQIFTKLSMLRSNGYLIDKKYYYNGEIRYSLHNPFNSSQSNFKIITDENTSKIRVVLTSDTHLGHINDELQCINNMTEYCINNDIHIVLNLGDFFEGMYKSREKQAKFLRPEEQISYALRNYPYDKNILNFVLLGNHDTTFFTNYGIDIKTILEERRHDIIPVDYGYGEINIGGAQFRLQHPLSSEIAPKIPNTIKKTIILKGHSHKFKITSDNRNHMVINVPSLSSVPTSGLEIIPSIIDMEVEIKNNTICDQYFRQFIFINNKPVCIGEFQYYNNIGGKTIEHESQPEPVSIDSNLDINSEESLTSLMQQTIIDISKDVCDNNSKNNGYESRLDDTSSKYRGMSQIEKFQAKYGDCYVQTKVLKK